MGTDRYKRHPRNRDDRDDRRPLRKKKKERRRRRDDDRSDDDRSDYSDSTPTTTAGAGAKRKERKERSSNPPPELQPVPLCEDNAPPLETRVCDRVPDCEADYPRLDDPAHINYQGPELPDAPPRTTSPELLFWHALGKRLRKPPPPVPKEVVEEKEDRKLKKRREKRAERRNTRERTRPGAESRPGLSNVATATINMMTIVRRTRPARIEFESDDDVRAPPPSKSRRPSPTSEGRGPAPPAQEEGGEEAREEGAQEE